MAKTQLQSALHQPLAAIMGTRAKVAALRVLWRASTGLPYREVVRRCGMAYGSVDLALGELTAIGLVTELPGGRERRVQLARAHRLAVPVSALLQAEADFFPALRVALVAALRPLVEDGLRSAALVGAAARREEQPGDAVELVLIASDATALARCQERIAAASTDIVSRYGVRLHVIGYDELTARSMWRKRTSAAIETVRSADRLAGEPLVDWLDAVATT